MEAVKIYTYSVLSSSSQEFKDKVPYITAILERSNGERFASLVDGYKDGATIAIGQDVVCTGHDAAGKETYALA
jgi:uncharacterized OB-fold protein